MKCNMPVSAAAAHSLAALHKAEGRLQGTLWGKHIPNLRAREAAEELTAQTERMELSNTESKSHQRFLHCH